MEEKVIGTMTKILWFIGIFVVLFVIANFISFLVTGQEQEALINGVFKACKIELIVMGCLKGVKWHLKKKLNMNLDDVGLEDESKEDEE